MSREERIQAVRDGVAEKMSSTEIAEAIGGCTRNAIIGLANRARISLVPKHRGPGRRQKTERMARPSKPPITAATARKDKPARPQEPLTPALLKKQPPIVDVEPIYEFPDVHYQVHLEDVKSGQCRRPTWNDDRRPGTEVYFFCGKPVRSGSPYCWHCHKKMYDGMPAQRREKNRQSERLTGRGELD
ncbi:GcrA family cell cycle regulator [Mesorhizobium sp.]|uniref:GcrA family cell cycle regulator n=1 Tax=Mesorhizobium sp. TaxID=1871066 RepID=UPI0025F8CE10|nr:GcrA family cell cycle regulator [Mesorhizobium sp.]